VHTAGKMPSRLFQCKMTSHCPFHHNSSPQQSLQGVSSQISPQERANMIGQVFSLHPLHPRGGWQNLWSMSCSSRSVICQKTIVTVTHLTVTVEVALLTALITVLKKSTREVLCAAGAFASSSGASSQWPVAIVTFSFDFPLEELETEA